MITVMVAGAFRHVRVLTARVDVAGGWWRLPLVMNAVLLVLLLAGCVTRTTYADGKLSVIQVDPVRVAPSAVVVP